VNFKFLYSLENRVPILVRQERMDLRFGTTKFPNVCNFLTVPTFTIQLNRTIGTLKEEELLVCFMTVDTSATVNKFGQDDRY